MTENQQKDYLLFITYLYTNYGIDRIDYVVDTKAFEILGISEEESFDQKKRQERFDLVKKSYNSNREHQAKFEFAKEAINKSANILKNPKYKESYLQDKRKKILNIIWLKIEAMCITGSITSNDYRKALKITKQEGQTELDLKEILAQNTIKILEGNEEEPFTKEVGGTPRIGINGSGTLAVRKNISIREIKLYQHVLEVFEVINLGGGALIADISSDSKWLKVSPSVITQEKLPQKVKVTVSPAMDKALKNGDKVKGSIIISSRQANVSSVRLTVEIEIEGAGILRERRIKETVLFSGIGILISFLVFSRQDLKNSIGMIRVDSFFKILSPTLFMYSVVAFYRKGFIRWKLLLIASILALWVYIPNISFILVATISWIITVIIFKRNPTAKFASFFIPIFTAMLAVVLYWHISKEFNSATLSFQTEEKNDYTIEIINQAGYINAKRGVNIRESPSTSSTIIYIGKNKEAVYVVGKDKITGWYQITIGERIKGYVSSKFVTLN